MEEKLTETAKKEPLTMQEVLGNEELSSKFRKYCMKHR
jgi:hypothetical protein